MAVDNEHSWIPEWISDAAWITGLTIWVLKTTARFLEPTLIFAGAYLMISQSVASFSNPGMHDKAIAILSGAPDIIIPGAIVTVIEEWEHNRKGAGVLGVLFAVLAILTLIGNAKSFGVLSFSEAADKQLLFWRAMTGIAYSINVLVLAMLKQNKKKKEKADRLASAQVISGQQVTTVNSNQVISGQPAGVVSNQVINGQLTTGQVIRERNTDPLEVISVPPIERFGSWPAPAAAVATASTGDLANFVFQECYTSSVPSMPAVVPQVIPDSPVPVQEDTTAALQAAPATSVPETPAPAPAHARKTGKTTSAAGSTGKKKASKPASQAVPLAVPETPAPGEDVAVQGKIRAALDDLGRSASDRAISRQANCSPATVKKYRDQLQAEIDQQRDVAIQSVISEVVSDQEDNEVHTDHEVAAVTADQ